MPELHPFGPVQLTRDEVKALSDLVAVTRFGGEVLTITRMTDGHAYCSGTGHGLRRLSPLTVTEQAERAKAAQTARGDEEQRP